MDYQINKHDPCVMNKIVKCKECTIRWRVDNLKMYHIDTDIKLSIISDIDIEYGNILKMITTLGKMHKYPGLTIDYY